MKPQEKNFTTELFRDVALDIRGTVIDLSESYE
jgi:hypothetical protein